jgi:hypothetical protein
VTAPQKQAGLYARGPLAERPPAGMVPPGSVFDEVRGERVVNTYVRSGPGWAQLYPAVVTRGRLWVCQHSLPGMCCAGGHSIDARECSACGCRLDGVPAVASLSARSLGDLIAAALAQLGCYRAALLSSRAAGADWADMELDQIEAAAEQARRAVMSWRPLLPALSSDMPLADMNLSVRTENTLARAGMHKVSDLYGRTSEELRRLGFGLKSVREICAKLESCGMAVPTLVAPAPVTRKAGAK